MWNTSYIHTNHTINKIGASQSPPLESFGPTLWESVSEPTWGYRASSDTICNDSRKSASHKCAIPQKDYSQLRHHEIVSKAQFNPVKTFAGKAFPRDIRETFCSTKLYYLIRTFYTHTIYTHITHKCWGMLLKENPSQTPWELVIIIPIYLYT